jgi:hypothetical protein
MSDWLRIKDFLKQSTTIKNRDYLYQLMNGKTIDEKKKGAKVLRRGKTVKKEIPPRLTQGTHWKIENGKRYIHKDLNVINGEITIGKNPEVVHSPRNATVYELHG